MKEWQGLVGKKAFLVFFYGSPSLQRERKQPVPLRRKSQLLHGQTVMTAFIGFTQFAVATCWVAAGGGLEKSLLHPDSNYHSLDLNSKG